MQGFLRNERVKGEWAARTLPVHSYDIRITVETYIVPRIMKAREPMEFLEHETPAPVLKITDDEEKGVWKGINWLRFGPPKLNVWGNREFCHRFSNDGLGSLKLAEKWAPPYLLTILLDARP